MKTADRKRIDLPHILVTIPTANLTQRRILEGVLAYAGERGPWLFHLNTGDVAPQGLKRANAWGIDGIIALSADEKVLERLFAFRKPIVLINPPGSVRMRRKDVVVIRRDNENLGRMAAEYLLGLGYRSFAFVGAPRATYWSDGRRDGFTRAVAAKGLSCAVYPAPSPAERADFSAEAPRLGAWLKALPKPTALYTVKDIRGQQILAACMDVGIAVPNELAVLGTDDDEILCQTTVPALSSIALDGAYTGRICAQALDDLLRGKKRHPLIDIAFPRIVPRRSTDAYAIEDPILARIIQNLRANLAKPPRLSALAAQFGVSVRSVELKALRHFGHPIREELNRIRLSEGIALLTNTRLTALDIARRCGFCDASHFSRAVKAAFGHPPGVFRPPAT